MKPAPIDDALKSPLAAIKRGSSHARWRHILIVDDDDLMLRAAHRALRSDMTITTATHPAEARHLSVVKKPDVAIVDLVLGDCSGIELISELKADRPNITIIAYSGYLTNDVVAAARRAGASIVESKSRSVRDLLRLVVAHAPDVAAVEQFYRRLLSLDGKIIESVLADALELLVECTQAQLAYAELFDEGQVPRFSCGHHADERALEMIRATISRGIVGRAIVDGETIETPSAFTDARFADLESVRANQVGAILCVPIRREERAIGVLYLQTRATSFSALDRDRAEVCAAQIGRVARCEGHFTLAEEQRALHYRCVRGAMLRSNWNISEAARELGVSRNFIYTVLGKRR